MGFTMHDIAERPLEMRNRCQLTINGRSIETSPGETLIDAALGAWMIIPHDCRSGQCESCRVSVVSGSVDDHGTAMGNTVLACQARVFGDAEIRFDELPIPEKRSGTVLEMSLLSPEVVEIIVKTDRALDYRPGQYVRVKFAGYPAREYSPTIKLDGTSEADQLVFHIRILPDGMVSGALGTRIRPGHRVHVQGPFGNAFLREGSGPLILVSGGTGWAPIWSVAHAARQTQRGRPLFVVAGSRDTDNSYMQPALNWLMDDGVPDVIATAEFGAVPPMRDGRPSNYLPAVGARDTIYVAGPLGLVDAVKQKARLGAAQCYADPFLPSEQVPSITDRVRGLLFGRASRPAIIAEVR
jgi:NAD(P)H-flavin reductase/ferredoxin